MSELISVIVPVYNIEQFLPKCLDSILSQTYTNFELLLIDDGATDSCPSICDAYTQQDHRIKVIHKKNGGLSDARNVGLGIASGEYICFIDSDDYVSPEYLQKLYEAMKKDDVDMSICQFQCVTEFGDIIEGNCGFKQSNNPHPVVLTEKECWERFFSHDIHVMVWNRMYKRKVFDTLRFPVGKISEDERIFQEILSRCNKTVVIPNISYYYTQRSSSITKSIAINVDFSIVDVFKERNDYFAEKGWTSFIDETNKALITMLAIKNNFIKTEFKKQRLESLSYIDSFTHKFSLSLKVYTCLFRIGYGCFGKIRQLAKLIVRRW